MNFERRKAFGQSGQDILINFLEKHFGYKFVAGERYGEIVNTDVVEELDDCEYIPPDGWMGARLRYVRKDREYILVMPDVFMSRNRSDNFYWMEVKTHTKFDNRIIIPQKQFLDYKVLYEECTRNEFYVMCLNPTTTGESHNVYWCEFVSLIEKEPAIEKMNGCVVCVWDIKQVMTRLNKYPIDIEKYK